MVTRQDKLDLLKKYYSLIANFPEDFFFAGNIPSKKVDHALRTFAWGMDRSTILAFYDTTIAESGKTGYIFTDDAVYYKNILETPGKVRYDDIKSVQVTDANRAKDKDRSLCFELYDGSSVTWTDRFLNKTPLCEFMTELLEIIHADSSRSYAPAGSDRKEGPAGAYTAGGTAAGNSRPGTVKITEEQFHASQGHGPAAERANTQSDQKAGDSAKILEDDDI